ncbi:MAG: bifunctional precorrin-2 dehydrogenase/sirohydrochlorin ferrochelatase [Candidatus Syntrophonatronum acetioxidans]|uniref:precorrin-2 dehydrogenase n=1 Tax=Candidatus Syntrophonatronum acetioxidans TaxID=1795816 RepID=A0A424YEB1_9FIRM|nr:MAG: bifunctional precorrin-2 dehydrogenase/sirohydrochlorin ferrochelatase [Candidatus Syntrophonatronum acetioxidans]
MGSFYPLSLDIEGRKVLVVGGGKVALRKVETLLSFNARVHLVSPEALPSLEEMADKGEIVFHREKYRRAFLKGAMLAIGATGDQQVNREVARDARRENIPVNVIDNPDSCTFLVPAVVKRGSLTISISTEGKSPALAAQVRKELESNYGKEYQVFLDYLGKVRNRVINEVSDPDRRREIFVEMSDPALVKLVKGDDLSLLEKKFEEVLNRILGE